MRTTADVSVANPMTLLDWSRLRADEYTTQWNKEWSPQKHREVVSERELSRIWGYDSTYNQLMPVRDKLPGLWRMDDHGSSVTVVGTHTSKSILLPVYRIAVPEVGVITMRDNFHDWCLSCDLELSLPLDVYGDFYYIETVLGFFEGFDRGGAETYGPFVENQQQFSLTMSPGFAELYFFMGLTRLAVQRMKRVTSLH